MLAYALLLLAAGLAVLVESRRSSRRSQERTEEVLNEESNR